MLQIIYKALIIRI